MTAYPILGVVIDENEPTGRLGIHSMRETFADVVHERPGRGIAKAKKALGHNVNSTDSYLSFLQEEIDAGPKDEIRSPASPVGMAAVAGLFKACSGQSARSASTGSIAEAYRAGR